MNHIEKINNNIINNNIHNNINNDISNNINNNIIIISTLINVGKYINI